MKGQPVGRPFFLSGTEAAAGTHAAANATSTNANANAKTSWSI